MAYSELIKNFEKIRAYMRDFYVYGFHTRNDFDRKSPRSYDNERRRIESWLGDSMAFRQDASGKCVFISLDSRETRHNPLYRALKAKSFTDKDITLHFYILDMLADGEKLSFKTIADRVQDYCQDIADDSFMPDDSTIRNKLKEYVSLGILKTEKSGRELLYSRCNRAWDMDAWKDAISFASEMMPLGTVGAFLLDKYPAPSDYFSFKHHYLMGALDSGILEELLACRMERKNALITFSTRRDKDGRYQALVYPMKIYISTRNGRENLLAYSFEERRPRMYRLDRIHAVKMMENQPEPEKLERTGNCFAGYLWGTSSGPDRNRELQRLTMRIRLEEDESFVADRLYREKRNGTVIRLDEHTYEFIAIVYDAQEILPWIRTFTGRIESLTCTDPEVTRRFYEDLQEMYEIYGGGNAVQ